jgi:hypothetical protein
LSDASARLAATLGADAEPHDREVVSVSSHRKELS